MSVEVLDQAHYKLKDRWPQLAQHTFIVASKTDMPKKWASDLEEVYGEMFAKKGVDYALMTKGIPHTLSKSIELHWLLTFVQGLAQKMDMM